MLVCEMCRPGDVLIVLMPLSLILSFSRSRFRFHHQSLMMNPVDGVNAFDAWRKGSHFLANDPLLMLRFEGVIILLSLFR